MATTTPTPLTYRSWLQLKANNTSPTAAWDQNMSSMLLNVVGDDGNLNGNAVQNNTKFTGADGQTYYTAGAPGDIGKGLMDVNKSLYGRYQNYLNTPSLISRYNQSTAPNGITGAGAGQKTTPTQPTADQAAYDTYLGQANKSLSDLLGQYNTSVQGENSAFNTAQNVNRSDFTKQQGNYNQAVTGQNQDLLRQTNQDMQGVSTAYRNLMDLLGAYGGGASSVALQWAPNAAKTYQDRLMSGDKQTAASNLASLASNWNDYTTGFDQRKQQQLDQHNQNLAQAKQDYTHTQAQLNRIIEAINNRSDTPGNIGTNLNTIEASIPNSVFVNPTYTGVTPSFTRPSLASFQSQMPTATISTSTMPTNSSATPVLNFLLSQGQKQKQDATAVAPVDLQKKTPVMF